MKHYLLFLLTLLTSASAFAYEAEVGGVYYNFKSDGTASVTFIKRYSSENSSAYSGAVNIPETVNYDERDFTVTTIEDYAFYACNTLTSVTLPSTLLTIGTSAFNGCASLTGVTIPQGVNTLGSRAFANCSMLAEVTFPTTLRSIGTYAFQNCSSIAHIVLPEGLSTISNNAFGACSGLQDIVFPQTLTSLGEMAFNECTSLREVRLPDNLSLIPYRAFEGCTSIGVVYIGKGTKEIAGHAFFDCPNLHDLYCCTAVRPASYTYSLGEFEAVDVHTDNSLIDSFHESINWGRSKSLIPLQCGTPAIALEGTTLKFTSPTNLKYTTKKETFAYNLDVTDVEESATTDDDGIDVLLTYEVRVKGTVPGVDDSEETIAELCWLDRELTITDGDDVITGIDASSVQQPVLFSSHDGVLCVSGLSDGQPLSVYAADGRLLGTTTAAGSEAQFQCPAGQTVIVRIGHKAVKVLVR